MPKIALKETKKEEKAVRSKKATKNVEQTIPMEAPSSSKGGISVDMYSVKGTKAGTVSLPNEIFGAKVNAVLMSQAVRVYLANQRRGTASTKTRGEVDLTTAKWYRQKGTGRARHGAKSAPIFVHGGVAHGPKPRDYSLSMPQKMRQKALLSSLTKKLADGHIIVVDGFEALEAKTKNMVAFLKAVALAEKTVLFVTPPVSVEGVKNVVKAGRNIKGLTLISANQLNTYEVLKNKHIVLMKNAVEVLEKTFVKGK